MKILLTAFTTLALAAAAPASITDKTLDVGEGIGGVKMGMTKAQVEAAAGKPLEENANGVLSYADSARTGRIFDVYLHQRTHRVRLIIQAGPGFTAPGGIHLSAKGALRKLKQAYPRMKLVRADTETDENVYRIKTRRGGRTVWTDFTPLRPDLDARIIQTTVLVPLR